MGDRKHIDRLFQERFKDFEAHPDDAVWDNIKAKLNEKKKKRRVIPIWWRYAGAAALLLLMFTIGTLLLNNSNTEQITPQIVDTEKKEEKDTTNNKSQNINSTIVNDANTPVISNVKENKVEGTRPSNTYKTVIENPLKSTKHAPSVANSNNTKDVINTKTSSGISKNKALLKKDAPKNIAYNSKNKIEEKNNSTLKNKTDIIDNEVHSPTQNSTAIAAAIKNSKTDTALNNNKKKETTEVATNNPKEKPQSIEDAIEENKLLLEEENTEVATSNKWSIAPNAAPVYFSSLGKGSTIGADFNENSKSGEVNMSYGLNASYALNNRLTIRSGINRVNLGYNTNDVLVFRSVSANASTKTLHTLSSNVSGNMAEPLAISAGEDVSIMSATAFKSRNILALETANTSINQSFGFIEVPLELQYAISTKRLGVNVIGGFSSLFLNNYESFSVVEGERTRLQENDNINNTSYSANFGLGLNYKVSKKINLNLEPMFKYQINTFKNTSGDFQPFFIGVYTGFGIKF
ncbi:outer membrane protein with beta-barrel domain [Jejuia pallidilutea]|uniref:Outer membrane protein with beta-barrel domain n=1 Tax=Jejuia pallidilutea TaxID=504487 RepID=A0A362X210_9FLAO|nr:outer membrane beta-barrel protein [Jejuia pallidilutea]PQV49505.1 outer membrane protein with beta-barrel domain [Jejuia pallidilutea]